MIWKNVWFHNELNKSKLKNTPRDKIFIFEDITRQKGFFKVIVLTHRTIYFGTSRGDRELRALTRPNKYGSDPKVKLKVVPILGLIRSVLTHCTNWFDMKRLTQAGAIYIEINQRQRGKRRMYYLAKLKDVMIPTPIEKEKLWRTNCGRMGTNRNSNEVRW